MKIRYFGNRRFECVGTGLWISDDLCVLREEFRGMRNYHDWVAERWSDRTSWKANEHFGIGLTMKEAAECLP